MILLPEIIVMYLDMSLCIVSIYLSQSLFFDHSNILQYNV